MTRPIQIAVIGAGGWTETCHIPCLQADPRVRVIALCGRTHEKVAAQASKFGIPRVVTDYRKVLAMEDVDGVTISTPNVSHGEIAMAAFRAGKHVFCEKPLAMNEQDGLEMARLAQASERVGHVAFTFRHLYGISKARELLAAGTIGKPFHARFWTEGNWFQPDSPIRWRQQKHLAGAGILGDMGSHLIDMAHYLMGPIDSVYGRLADAMWERPDGRGGTAIADADDVATWIARFRSGCDGLFFASWASGGKNQSGVEVQGTKGTLKITYSRGDQDKLELWTPTTGWQELPLEGAPEPNHAMYKMLKAFADAIDGQATPHAAATFADGYNAQTVQDAVAASSSTGEAVRVAYRL